jgi:virginiamycin B lyase
VGPDRNLWITQENAASSASVIRLVPATGALTEYPLPVIGPRVGAITAGADGNLWFVQPSANRIGRLRP